MTTFENEKQNTIDALMKLTGCDEEIAEYLLASSALAKLNDLAEEMKANQKQESVSARKYPGMNTKGEMYKEIAFTPKNSNCKRWAELGWYQLPACKPSRETDKYIYFKELEGETRYTKTSGI